MLGLLIPTPYSAYVRSMGLTPVTSDYALQITQGQDDINYSGLFSLTGGSAASSGTTSITSSTTRTGNSTMTSTASITSATNGTMTSNGTER